MAFSSKINSITSPALSPLTAIKIITWVYYNGFYEKDNMFINQHVYHGPFMIFFFFFTFILFYLFIFFLQWFLSYIEMNQPWIYMYSPSRFPLPPPSH